MRTGLMRDPERRTPPRHQTTLAVAEVYRRACAGDVVLLSHATHDVHVCLNGWRHFVAVTFERRHQRVVIGIEALVEDVWITPQLL